MTLRFDWLLLDADDTLLDFRGTAPVALERACRAVLGGWQPDWFELYHEVNQALWRALEAGELTADELRDRRFASFAERLGADVDGRDFDNRYLDELAAVARPLDGALGVLERLSGRVGLAVATNGLAAVQSRRLEVAGLASHLRPVVISEEVGAAKPDPLFFEAALDRLGGPPRERVLMVGDGLETDIRGALAAGLPACWYNPSGAPAADGIVPTYEIRRLADLVDLVFGDVPKRRHHVGTGDRDQGTGSEPGA